MSQAPCTRATSRRAGAANSAPIALQLWLAGDCWRSWTEEIRSALFLVARPWARHSQPIVYLPADLRGLSPPPVLPAGAGPTRSRSHPTQYEILGVSPDYQGVPGTRSCRCEGVGRDLPFDRSALLLCD